MRLQAVARARLRSDEGPRCADELLRLTGLSVSPARLDKLPDHFLDATAPSPADIAELPGVRRRTVTVMRRHLAGGTLAATWTFRRLIALPGFGMGTLLDVLRAWRDPRRNVRLLREPPSAALDRRVAVVVESLPASEEHVWSRLQAAGLASGPVRLSALERALRSHDGPCPFVVVRRPGLALVVVHEQAAAVRRAHAVAVWKARRGPAEVAEVAGYARVEPSVVEAVVSAHRDLQWLDRRAGRFGWAARSPRDAA